MYCCVFVIHTRTADQPYGAGISSSYDEGYPPELEGWMAREEWLECMGRINRRASSTPRKTDGGIGPRSEMLLVIGRFFWLFLKS